MTDKPRTSAAPAAAASTPTPLPSNLPPLNRGPHRGTDMRDTMAELTERAHLISLEAGTRIAAAMRDVISAGAGITGFSVESARDLVQFMVRRGQMTQDESDKLIREAEAAHAKRPASERNRPTASRIAADKAAVMRAEAQAKNAAAAAAYKEELQARRLSVAAAAKKAAAKPEKAEKPVAAKKAAAPAKAPAKAAPAKAPAAKAAAKPAAKGKKK
jgi:polyhydroxyalkanoate synthesis regulator phasin